jgi:DNA-binding SARP family transcriptional activator
MKRVTTFSVMLIGLLGPLEVHGSGGEAVLLGGAKQRAVLAVLALRAGEVVSQDFLVDAVWGEQAPRSAVASLQNSISALRKLLGPETVLTRPPGYLLAVDREQVDLFRFERLVRDARGLEPVERAVRLREALVLWRGEPLAEIAFEAFAVPEVRRLDELRVGCLEEALQASLDAGEGAEIVPDLEALVAQNPHRERIRGQLMLALYRAGRQGDALAAYQDARRALVEELGLEPSPQLQQLHAAILRQEVQLDPTAAIASPEEHLAEVAAVLLAGRLVPVLGASGAELASRLSDRFEAPPGELARVAQYVALTKGFGPLYDELRALLEASTQPTAVHRFFASLPPLLRERGLPHQLIVTASYDLSLEQALLEAGEEFDVVSYIASGRDRGRFCHLSPEGSARVIDVPNTYATELSLDRRTVILKVHGSLGAVESFVVTEDDYIDYGPVASAIPVALAAKLQRSHFLFLGFGMRDWNLRLVLGRIWNGTGISYRSWAVLPEAPSLERQFWRTRDIDLLEVTPADYVAGLSRYVGLPEEVPA